MVEQGTPNALIRVRFLLFVQNIHGVYSVMVSITHCGWVGFVSNTNRHPKIIKNIKLENEMKIESTLKGSRILSGEYVKKRRKLLNSYIEFLENDGFSEIVLPIIESSQIYIDKAGEEVLKKNL